MAKRKYVPSGSYQGAVGALNAGSLGKVKPRPFRGMSEIEAMAPKDAYWTGLKRGIIFTGVSVLALGGFWYIGTKVGG